MIMNRLAAGGIDMEYRGTVDLSCDVSICVLQNWGGASLR